MGGKTWKGGCICRVFELCTFKSAEREDERCQKVCGGNLEFAFFQNGNYGRGNAQSVDGKNDQRIAFFFFFRLVCSIDGNKQFFNGFQIFLSGLFQLVNFDPRCLISFKCCKKEKRYLQIKLAVRLYFSIIKNFLKFKPLREKYERAIVSGFSF